MFNYVENDPLIAAAAYLFILEFDFFQIPISIHLFCLCFNALNFG